MNEKKITYLNIILKNPTFTKSKIQDLTGISPATQTTYFEQLKNKGVLPRTRLVSDEILGNRKATGFMPILDYEKLNLKTWLIHLYDINIDQYKGILYFFENHSYIVEIQRTIIPKNNLLIRLECPDEVIPDIEKYLSLIQSYQFINNFLISNMKYYGKTNHDVENLDLKNNEKNMMLNNIFTSEVKQKLPSSEQDPIKFDQHDLKLIRELQLDANLNVSSVQDDYEFDQSTLSRRINKIKDKVINGYHVKINLESEHIEKWSITGKATTTTVNQIYHAISNDNFWFPSEIYLGSNQFLWNFDTNSKDFKIILDTLKEYAIIDKIQLLDRAKNKFFRINPADYDDNDGNWKIYEIEYVQLANQLKPNIIEEITNQFLIFEENFHELFSEEQIANDMFDKLKMVMNYIRDHPNSAYNFSKLAEFLDIQDIKKWSHLRSLIHGICDERCLILRNYFNNIIEILMESDK